MLVLEQRKRIKFCTSGQRRVYNGAYGPEWEDGWSSWDWLSLDLKPSEVEEKLAWWRDLNAYSVSVGGTTCEYRVIEKESPYKG